VARRAGCARDSQGGALTQSGGTAFPSHSELAQTSLSVRDVREELGGDSGSCYSLRV